MRIDDYCHAVIRSAELTPAARHVLWAIAYYVNRRDGTTYVSRATIADDCGLSVKHVSRMIGELRRAGVFDVAEHPGRSSTYRFPIHPSLSTTRDMGVPTPGTSRSGVPGTSETPTRDIQVPNPGHPGPTNQENHVRNRDALRPLPRPELVATGLYAPEHWEAM